MDTVKPGTGSPHDFIDSDPRAKRPARLSQHYERTALPSRPKRAMVSKSEWREVPVADIDACRHAIHLSPDPAMSADKALPGCIILVFT